MNDRGIRFSRRLEAALVLVAGIAFGSWREFAFINLNTRSTTCSAARRSPTPTPWCKAGRAAWIFRPYWC